MTKDLIPMRTLARKTLPVLIGTALVLSSCVLRPKVAYNPRVDFSKIRRVGVMTFSGPGGAAAADILTQDLVSAGVDVVERQRLDSVLQEQHLSESGVFDPQTTVALHKILGVDALIIGSVTSYSPGQSYLVQSGDSAIRVGENVTPVPSRNIYSSGSVLGVPNTQILSTAASVGLTSRMVDVQTGSVLWSARMNYEGFDTEATMETITSSFVKSLAAVWPSVQIRKR